MSLGSTWDDGRPLYQPPPQGKGRKGWTKQQKERMTDEQIYSRLRDEYLAENPVCTRPGCVRVATQLHHIVSGTAGKSLSRLNPDTWLSCCSDQCHDWIEKLPFEMQKMLKALRVQETIDRLRT